MTIQTQSADGVIHQFPDGTPQAVVDKAMRNYAAQPHGQAQAPPQQPKQSGAIAGIPDLGGGVNSFLAGDLQFTHNIPFVGDAVLTASRYARDALAGEHPTWQGANAEVHQILGDAGAKHPVSSIVGGAAGAIDSAVLGGAALKAAGGGEAALSALPKGGSLLANGARLAAAGAATGATQGAVQSAGEDLAAGRLPDTGKAAKAALGGAAAGAVLGPAGGAVAAGARRVTAPLSAKVAQAMSKVFGENPSDLQAAWQAFKDNTGRAPSMAELATLKQRGEIANAAKDSTAITTTLTQAADDAARARSDNMQDFVQQRTAAQGPPAVQSSGEVANATTKQGDVDYPAARLHDFTLPTEESEALGGVSPADHTASQIVPLAGLKTADKVRIVEGLKTGHLSGQDAQLLRSKLTTAQGTGNGYSPAIASAQEDLDDFLNGAGNEAAADALARANANYAAGAQRAAGAAHGETITGAQTADNFAAEAAAKPNANGNFAAGVASGARSKLADTAATPRGAESLAGRLATDDSLHAKLTTTFGQDAADALRRMGQAESGAAENMAAFRKTNPGADDQDGKDASTALRALASVASHGVYKIYHGAKALSGLGMSPAVQETVARYLSDPKMVPQGIALLRKAGATNAQLRDLALKAAQGSGALSGSAAGDLVEGQ